MPIIQTVLGPISSQKLGFSLVHEHIMVDFIGADKTGEDRWDRKEVFQIMKPYLEEAYKAGIRSFFDCTPAYLGRDPVLLKELSRATQIHIITNTGWYKEPYLPGFAFNQSPEKIAEKWIQEANDGIDKTKIKPGFIKIAVNPGPLVEIQKKIVQAAALTQKATGLTVASHTAEIQAALQELDLFEKSGGDLSRFIVVHADAIPDLSDHLKIADRGAWVEYDSIGWKRIEEHLHLIMTFLDKTGPERLLISQDSGWYNVGEPTGGKIRGYTALINDLVPALRDKGIPDSIIDQLTVTNPIKAFGLPDK